MNSELGMILPFAFALFVVWSGTRIIIARMQLRRGQSPESEASLADLAKRVEQIEESLDATTKEMQRLVEAERFTAQLLSSRGAAGQAEPEGMKSQGPRR